MERRKALAIIGAGLVAITPGCAQLVEGTDEGESSENPTTDPNSSTEENGIEPSEQENTVETESSNRIVIRNSEETSVNEFSVRTEKESGDTYIFESTVEIPSGESVTYSDALQKEGAYRVQVEVQELDIQKEKTFHTKPDVTLSIVLRDGTLYLIEAVPDCGN